MNHMCNVPIFALITESMYNHSWIVFEVTIKTCNLVTGSHHDMAIPLKNTSMDRHGSWVTFVRSGSVVTAILAEVKPHISKMKDARSKLQKSVDAAKVGFGNSVWDVWDI